MGVSRVIDRDLVLADGLRGGVLVAMVVVGVEDVASSRRATESDNRPEFEAGIMAGSARVFAGILGDDCDCCDCGCD